MKRFKYVKLYWDSNGIIVGTPNEEVADWIVTQVRGVIPGAKVGGGSEVGWYHIYKLQGRDYEIGNQILRELLGNGWQPFSVTKGGVYEQVIHLRFEVE